MSSARMCPESGEASFDDIIYGHIAVDCAELDDMILIKADGMPTYNFANVIDDHTDGASPMSCAATNILPPRRSIICFMTPSDGKNPCTST